MRVDETDESIEALDDWPLRKRLARDKWQTDAEYISNEQLFRLFRRARDANNCLREGLLSEALSRRILALAQGFAIRSKIVPGLIGDIREAANELSQYVWDCLLSRPDGASHAQQYFGQYFLRRALDFQRRLLAKKRKLQDSLDAMEHSSIDDDPEKTIKMVSALRQEASPEVLFERKEKYRQIYGRLQTVLAKNEYSVLIMLYEQEMAVKDIATALGVTTRSVNNYKNSALGKIEMEFKNDITQS